MIASLSPISVFSTVRQARPEASPSSRDAEADGATSRAEQDGKSERSEPAAQVRGQGPGQLSEADQQRLRALQQRDREVRAHEMAHVAAGGSLIRSGASFTYESGPDGQRYAIGGEVGIDTSPGRTPAETLAKADQIRAAALAPADPSGQDRQVAAMATRMAMQASMDLATEGGATQEGKSAGVPGRQPMLAYTGAATGEQSSGSAIDLFA
ncbi:MAG TPA: putative metalloprotease CJM1_0395 family protein [Candidatus Accumulibacter phosphatis]|nr:putative metalloprotease CJM1_0395 family protein [Candidatus Accumulibacter phosphatis]